MATVYALYSSRDDVTRYVGQTNKAAWDRYCRHMIAAKGTAKPCPVTAWMRAELKAGYAVKYRVLKADAVWSVDERAEIARLREQGIDLINISDGGEGITEAGIQRLKETKANLAEQHYWDRVFKGSKPYGYRAAERVLLNFYTTGRISHGKPGDMKR